jgi:hypothetical protein
VGLLNLREISKILSKIDPAYLENAEATLERGKRLQDALFAYLDAHDERVRIGEALQSGEWPGIGRFDLAVEAEEATLERIRDIVRPMRESPPR